MDTDRLETPTDVELTEGEKETPKEQTYTQAQLDAHGEERAQQARSSALADVGRIQKEAANARKAIEASDSRINRWKVELEEAEDKAAAGDTEQMSALKERKLRRDAVDELDKLKLKLNDSDEELSQIKSASAEATTAQTAREIATRLNVDADKRIDAAKFTDGSKEAMDALANLQKKKQEIRPPTKTDSGADTGGGTGSFTLGEISNMSDDEYTKNKGAIEKARMAGKIKR